MAQADWSSLIGGLEVLNWSRLRFMPINSRTLSKVIGALEAWHSHFLVLNFYVPTQDHELKLTAGVWFSSGGMYIFPVHFRPVWSCSAFVCRWLVSPSGSYYLLSYLKIFMRVQWLYSSEQTGRWIKGFNHPLSLLIRDERNRWHWLVRISSDESRTSIYLCRHDSPLNLRNFWAETYYYPWTKVNATVNCKLELLTRANQKRAVYYHCMHY